MGVLFAVPDAIVHRLVMWHVRRKYTRVQSAVRLLYVAVMLSTLGHLYHAYPTRANRAIADLVALALRQLKLAARLGACGIW